MPTLLFKRIYLWKARLAERMLPVITMKNMIHILRAIFQYQSGPSTKLAAPSAGPGVVYIALQYFRWADDFNTPDYSNVRYHGVFIRIEFPVVGITFPHNPNPSPNVSLSPESEMIAITKMPRQQSQQNK